MSTTRDIETKYICHACIGDQYLADEVKEKGVQAKCSYCGGTCGAFTLDELADRIHKVLEEHFELTPSEPDVLDYALMHEGLSEWYRDGQPVEGAIADIADLSEQTAGDVRSLLFSLNQHEAIVEGEENPYDFDASYEETGARDWRFPNTWDAFRTQIRSRSRFFSKNIERMLDEIFGDLGSLRAHPNSPVIVDVGPEDNDRFVWRARQAHSEQELRAILRLPVRGLGPPPSSVTRSGRMNAQGIPVFYGALEESTCVSEIRPAVGGYVVLARFELLQPMRLLSLPTLEEVYVGGSYFNPDYAERKARAAFLRDLVRELSQPVMPQDEAVEYLTTQVVAEYLGNGVEPRLDGMIFPSSQTGGKGRNVMLFNHASRVEPRDQSGIDEIRVYVPPIGEEGEDDEVAVIEYAQAESPPKSPLIEEVHELHEDDVDDDDPRHDDEPALRLDLESIQVMDVIGVEYICNRRDVRRSRVNDLDRSFNQQF